MNFKDLVLYRIQQLNSAEKFIFINVAFYFNINNIFLLFNSLESQKNMKVYVKFLIDLFNFNNNAFDLRMFFFIFRKPLNLN